MIPIGYMAKRVVVRPDWLEAGRVVDVYSVSGCISKDFADYVGHWKHNGYWLFDSPEIIQQLAGEYSLDLAGTALFFYEAHGQAFHEADRQWRAFEPDASLRTNVVSPAEKTLEGYDVVTFSTGNKAECSPLSCNGRAREVETNSHCLLPSLDRAQRGLNEGHFDNTEPGPFRIFAVYSVSWPSGGRRR
jgi:hypothetical protein